MAFHDVRFPTSISVNATGGPGFKTTIVMTDSGYEQRNIDWSIARGRWNVAHAVKTQTQIDELVEFFRARYGRAHSFRFKDFLDFNGTNETIGTGDGSDATWQIIKTYTSGGYSYVRNITKPVIGELTVKVNNVTKTETTHYTVDYATGIITFTAGNIPANGHAIVCTYEFDCHCRFDIDQLDATILYPPYTGTSQLLATWDNIPIIEIKD